MVIRNEVPKTAINGVNDLIFISPSNINPKFSNNTISIGVSLESQLIALTKFIKKQKKSKTIIMYPKNEYLGLVEEKLDNLNLKEIGLVLDVSESRVSQIHGQAIARLKSKLSDWT